MQEILALFCFISAEKIAAIENWLISGRMPLFTHSLQGIAAIFTRISPEEYCSEAGEKQMQDLTWLTPRLLWHEEIIELVMRHAPVFPIRFGTLFSSLASLEQQIIQYRSLILAALHKTAGHQEWAVKGMLDQAKSAEKFSTIVLAEQQEQLSRMTAGTRYLKEQHVRNTVKLQLNTYLQSLYQTAWQAISNDATDICEREITSMVDRQTVSNWALLLADNKVAEFHALLEQLNVAYSEYGLHFNATGPWPPYSFCYLGERPG